MDQYFAGSMIDLPPEVQRLLAKPGALSGPEARLLEAYLAQNSTTLDPGMARAIGTKIGTAPPDWRGELAALTPPPGAPVAPSVADQVNATQATAPSQSSPLDAVGALLGGAGATIDSMPDPVGAILPNIPGLSATGRAILGGTEIPAPPSLPMPPPPPTTGPGDDLAAEATNPGGGPRLSPDLPVATPSQDFTGATAHGFLGVDSATAGATANPLPDQGGANDRRAERQDRQAERGGGTDWKIEALGPDSAFAGIEAGMLPTVEASPAIAADLIARARGGGTRAGDLIEPQVAALMNLNQAGLLGGKGVGPNAGIQSSAGRLGAAEALYNEMGPGSYLDPQSLHRQTLRNIRRTDPGAMASGEGTAGDVNNQIDVTNSAILAAAAASMAPDALEAMQSRLAGAEQEYIMGVVDGSIAPDTMSYPEWLRTEKRVRKWVGPGTTQEQWQRSFGVS